jgi:hypothetical protein
MVWENTVTIAVGAARKHGRKITLDFALPKEPRQF